MFRILLCALPLLSSQAKADDPHTLSVTGEGKSTVLGTVADVRVGVEVEGTTAPKVQQQLAQVASKVYRVLEQGQVDKLQTGTLQVLPEYDKGNPPTILGYRGHVDISFSVPVDKAGAYIDAAVAAGANKMNGFTIRPADDALASARLEALQKAVHNALQEANTVLKTLGMEGKKIIKINIVPAQHVGPIYPRAYGLTMATAKAAPETEIENAEQEVHGTVELNFQIN